MKELIFVTPNLSNGGAERVTAVLAEGFATKGYKTTVAFMKDNKNVYSLSENVTLEYVFSDDSRLKKILKKIWRLRKMICEHPEASIIAMLPYETLYTFLACLGLKRKVIYSLRNDPANMQSKLEKLIHKQIYPRADKIVFQTEDAKNYFPDKVQKKGVIIPNPINGHLPWRFEGERMKEIVTVGRMVQQKNYPLLLNAFVEVHKRFPDWKLRIFGQGPLETELKLLCEKLEIEDCVEFCGFVENVSEKIYKSGMFVLSSDYEGISNAMLEALAMGIPCICTDCPVGGTRMAIKNRENGMLVPVGDKQALVAAMEEIIENHVLAEKISKKAVEIRSALSVDTILKQWEQVL